MDTVIGVLATAALFIIVMVAILYILGAAIDKAIEKGDDE